MNYTETEVKVREATNNDGWGPTGPQLHEITQLMQRNETYVEVMNTLWRRLFHEGQQLWRPIYKSLAVLSHLVKNGPERVVRSARDHIYDLRGLENFQFVDEMGKDQGLNVRHKVKDFIELIQDDDRLRSERRKTRENRSKYGGYSNEDAGNGWGGGSFRASDSGGRNGYSDRSYSPDGGRDSPPRTFSSSYNKSNSFSGGNTLGFFRFRNVKANEKNQFVFRIISVPNLTIKIEGEE